MNINQGGNIIILPEDIETGLIYSQNGYTVIYAGDRVDIPTQFVKAPILLPPQSAVTADLAGDMDYYGRTYFVHLRGNDVAVYMLDSIITGFVQGLQIAILFEAQELSHLNFFCNHLSTMYGITPGTPNQSGMFNPNPNQMLEIAASMFRLSVMDSKYMNHIDFIRTVSPDNFQYFMTNIFCNHSDSSIMPKLCQESGFDYTTNPTMILNHSAYYNQMEAYGQTITPATKTVYAFTKKE